MTTLLDSNQVLQHSFDDDAQALKIVGTATGGKVDITATSPIPVTLSGSSNLDILASYNINYTNITTSYYQVVASTTDAYSKIAIYETTGETIELALGGSGSEVVKMIIGPGNDQVVEIQIPAGSRIAVKASANATAGSLILNLLGAV